MLMDIILFSLPSVLLLICSILFYKFPPKKSNLLIGYRTARSMANKESWYHVNKYASKLMLNLSIAYFLLSVFLIGITIIYTNLYWITFSIIYVGSMVIFIPIFIKTEKYLKNL